MDDRLEGNPLWKTVAETQGRHTHVRGRTRACVCVCVMVTSLPPPSVGNLDSSGRPGVRHRLWEQQEAHVIGSVRVPPPNATTVLPAKQSSRLGHHPGDSTVQ